VKEANQLPARRSPNGVRAQVRATIATYRDNDQKCFSARKLYRNPERKTVNSAVMSVRKNLLKMILQLPEDKRSFSQRKL
jgi:hypothetical protein